jgi:hypothetical protein
MTEAESVDLAGVENLTPRSSIAENTKAEAE